jgi:hypothetical protein
MGVRRIDLGLADAGANPGLARFKTGAGGVVRTLGGSWLDSAWLPRPSAALARTMLLGRAIRPSPTPR